MAKTTLTGEILHAVAVRMRVVGSGNLKLYLHTLDEIFTDQLPSIPMLGATNIEPTVLANFSDQRIQLEIKTTQINDQFNISKIIVFVKPVAQGYPVP